MKPKEYEIWEDPSGYEHSVCELIPGESSNIPTPGFIHVIEYSAYEAMKKVAEEIEDDGPLGVYEVAYVERIERELGMYKNAHLQRLLDERLKR